MCSNKNDNIVLPLSGRRLTRSSDILVKTDLSTSSIMEALPTRLAIDILANSFDPRPNGFPVFLLVAVSREDPTCFCVERRRRRQPSEWTTMVFALTQSSLL